MYKKLNKRSNNAVLDVYRMLMEKIGCEVEEALYCSPYVYLQILYQYMGIPNAPKESLITIDEAQEMEIEEIRLIKNVNGNALVLNLFGDVKQHIEGTKGISDWNDIKGVFEYTLYEMHLKSQSFAI